MTTYTYSIAATDLSTGSLMQHEVDLYGSNRPGSLKLNRDVELTKQLWDTTYTWGLGLENAVKSPFFRGIKQYELSNLLGMCWLQCPIFYSKSTIQRISQQDVCTIS